MDDGPRGFRFSSARRNRRGPSPAVIAAVAAVSLVVVIAVLYRPTQPEIVETVPTPTQPPTPAPSPTATTPPTPLELASEWVVASSPELTPTPWPTSPPPARREPTPTPKVSQCVSYRWTTIQVFTPSAQVLTEIKAQNNCNRDIQPTDLMFEISGWRDGGLVQSVRGMPFDRIRRRHSGIISIGLPGSLDWYDEITVVIID
jgi:outer membrane biosynthesis protein TonB